MGKYAEANTAISLAASQVLTASCISVAGSSDLSGMEQEETEDKDPAASRCAQGWDESLPHSQLPRHLRSERAGLDSFSYPSPFINQGKY